MITLRQLEIFLATARVEHVTAAASAVHLSQSAVSAALAELAERLGGPLFERSGRRLVLNERGRRLAGDAADLLQRAEALMRRYTTDETLTGGLRIGASSTIGMYLLPDLIGSFLAEHPGVQVDLEIANTEAIEARLLARQLDIGFIEGPSRSAETAATSWRDDELVVFAAAGHPLCKRRRLGLADLTGERWVMREPGSGTRSVFEGALREHDLQVLSSVTFGHSEAVKQGVRAGLGIGCLSSLALRRELAAGEFVALRVQGLDLRRRLWQIVRRGAYTSPLQQACMAHFASSAGPRRSSRRRTAIR